MGTHVLCLQVLNTYRRNNNIMLSLSCALSHSPVPSLLSCALSALLCPLSLSCSLSAFLHLFLVVSCVPVPLRLPTLPPLPDMMIAAISVMYGSPLCLPSLTAVIAGGLYLLPDTMIVTSWGTAPCTANTVNQCRPPLLANGGCIYFWRQADRSPPLGAW